MPHREHFHRKCGQKSAIERAFEFRRLLDGGAVNSQAEIARRFGISRARVTQLLNLLKLPVDVLSLLAESGDSRWSERQLRGTLALPSQEDQIAALGAMAPDPYRQTLSQGEPARSALGSPGYRGETATQ